MAENDRMELTPLERQQIRLAKLSKLSGEFHPLLGCHGNHRAARASLLKEFRRTMGRTFIEDATRVGYFRCVLARPDDVVRFYADLENGMIPAIAV